MLIHMTVDASVKREKKHFRVADHHVTQSCDTVVRCLEPLLSLPHGLTYASFFLRVLLVHLAEMVNLADLVSLDLLAPLDPLALAE